MGQIMNAESALLLKQRLLIISHIQQHHTTDIQLTHTVTSVTTKSIKHKFDLQLRNYNAAMQKTIYQSNLLKIYQKRTVNRMQHTTNRKRIKSNGTCLRQVTDKLRSKDET